LQQIIGDVRAVDVAGNVECGGKQCKETGDKHQHDDVLRLTMTHEFVIPQLPSVIHLQHTLVTHTTIQYIVLSFSALMLSSENAATTIPNSGRWAR